MGLFSNKKKYYYVVNINNAKMTFNEFKEVGIAFLGSEEAKKFAKDNNSSLDLDNNFADIEVATYGTAIEGSAQMAPDGKLNILFLEKGPKEGLAFVAYTVRMNVTLKKEDKKWINEFFKKMWDYYENAFNPGGNPKNKISIGYNKI